MAHDPINTGYARALLDLALAENAVGRVEEELFRLRELLKANPALLEFLKNPNIKHEGKRQALAQLFQTRVHPLVLNLLIAISDQDRGGRIPQIIEQFIAQAAAARQSVTGEVVTAGEVIVKMNFESVDKTLENLIEVNIPEKVTSKTGLMPPVAEHAPDFVQNVTARMIEGKR